MPTDDELQSVFNITSKVKKIFKDEPTDVAFQILSIVKLRGLIDDSQGIVKTVSLLDKLASASENAVSPAAIVGYLNAHKDAATKLSEKAFLGIYRDIARDKVYFEQKNSMTGRLTKFEKFESQNSVEFSFPYQGGTTGQLLLRNDPQFGKDVIFQISKGQILCNSFSGCSVAISIDGGPVFNVSGIGPEDGSTSTIFFNWSLVAKLKDAKSIKIQPPTFQNGRPVFEFDLSGIDIARMN